MLDVHVFYFFSFINVLNLNTGHTFRSFLFVIINHRNSKRKCCVPSSIIIMYRNTVPKFHVAACVTYIVIKCVKSVVTYLNIYHKSEICGCTLIKIILASSSMPLCYKLQQITYNLTTKINTRYP